MTALTLTGRTATPRRLLRLALLALSLASLEACGGTAASHPAAHVPTIEARVDGDPLAVLPGAAALLVSVDARAFYASGSGAQAGPLLDGLFPVGAEAGFVPSRDVDWITIGVYSMEGADFAAVINGRFDAAKVDQAAQSHAATRGGATIAVSQYAGRSLYTVGDVGFTILTPRTALAGTQTGMKRTLDRIHDGRLQRDLPPWMIQAVETKGPAIVVAGDLANQQLSQLTATAPMLATALAGLRVIRLLADFHDPGLNVAGTLTYADAQTAQTAAGGLRQAGNLANILAISGVVPQLRGLDVNVAESNVQAKFAVDDQSLRAFLSHVSQWTPPGAGSRR